MNTPPSRKPRRYKRFKPTSGQLPPGEYKTGITNERFAILFAQNTANWVHIEDQMIEVLGDLIGGKSAPARQIFKSIISNKARKMVMLACLERSPINANKSAVYDTIIQQFSELNGRRNTFLHGLWYTHDSGRIFLSEESVDDHHWMEVREVEFNEMEAMNNLMWALSMKIKNRHAPNWVTVPASPETPPPRSRVNKKLARQARNTKRAARQPLPQSS